MSSSERLCSKPGCNQAGIHLCSGCGEESYCSKECQKENWAQHKIACKLATKPETAAILQSFDNLSIKQLKNLVKAKAATMEPKKKAVVLGQLENIVEKNNLLWLVKQHVQPAEIEVLLTNNPPSVQPTQVEVPTGSRGGSVKRKVPMKKSNDTQGQFNQTPNPQQLREQASIMRKNPDLVRKSNPAFLKMSNAQIIAYAEQLEKAASDPVMLKEIEKMSKLSSTERDQLQVIQEGLSGVRDMDDHWMNTAIKTLKQNPELIKSMFRGKGDMLGGVSDSQIEGFIDGASRMDATILKYILRILKFLGSLAKPASELYTKLNTYTFGQANTIITAVVLGLITLFIYLSYRFMALIFRLIYSFFSAIPTVVTTKQTIESISPKVSEMIENVVTTTTTSTLSTVATTATTAAGVASKIGDVLSTTKESTLKSESVDSEFEF